MGIKIKLFVTVNFKMRSTFTVTQQCFIIKLPFYPQRLGKLNMYLKPRTGHVGLSEGASANVG